MYARVHRNTVTWPVLELWPSLLLRVFFFLFSTQVFLSEVHLSALSVVRFSLFTGTVITLTIKPKKKVPHL